MRKSYILGLILVVGLIIGPAWAEQLTITTYYPAPYGVYRQMNIQHILHFGNSDVSDVADPSQIPTPEDGMLVYEKDIPGGTRKFKYYDDTMPGWRELGQTTRLLADVDIMRFRSDIGNTLPVTIGLMAAVNPSDNNVYVRTLESKVELSEGNWEDWSLSFGRPDVPASSTIEDISVSIGSAIGANAPGTVNSTDAIIIVRMSSGTLWARTVRGRQHSELDNPAVWSDWESFGSP